jgi:hypothetical protein
MSANHMNWQDLNEEEEMAEITDSHQNATP